jgi:putative membrane protein
MARDVSVVPAKPETNFSWIRTRLSIERTLMSWIRTAAALIGFGFTIFQFFERFNQTPGVDPAAHPSSPRIIALSLIGIGALGLLLAIFQYRQLLRYLWSAEFELVAGVGDKKFSASPALYAAVLLTIVGIIAFAAVLLRTG